MNTIRAIQKTLNCVDLNGIKRGWVIYYDNSDKIKEIKNLFSPTQYDGSRYVHNDEEIIEKLINEKNKK
jgi:hypothetical protein